MSETEQGTPQFIPVILAGGSGTRFWPRSRRTRAKQVLSLDGPRTMIQQTIDRLAGLADAGNIRIIANDNLAATIQEQLPEIAAEHLLCEPAARNTAPACGLAAFLVERTNPDAILGIFPSDHVVTDTRQFQQTLRNAIGLAASGANIVVLGVPPSRPETGYGYIEQGDQLLFGAREGFPVRKVRRFTEKPDRRSAVDFLATGRYAWNSGIFLWSARTLCNAIREHAPALAESLGTIAAAHGTPAFAEVFAQVYPGCENISIDYAVLEPQSRKGETDAHIYCLPADFGWNDLGSWSALHEHSLSIAAPGCDVHSNVADGEHAIVIDSTGNYVYAPGKQIALIGVQDLVVVLTEDAVLVTTRHRSQDVGQVVKTLHSIGHQQLT